MIFFLKYIGLIMMGRETRTIAHAFNKQLTLLRGRAGTMGKNGRLLKTPLLSFINYDLERRYLPQPKWN
jgi:hypothetical protein